MDDDCTYGLMDRRPVPGDDDAYDRKAALQGRPNMLIQSINLNECRIESVSWSLIVVVVVAVVVGGRSAAGGIEVGATKIEAPAPQNARTRRISFGSLFQCTNSKYTSNYSSTST